MNKKNQYNIKDYINSFSTQKKIAIYLSVALLLFHLLSIIIYLIERTDITILTESNIISVITSMLTISFSISEILDVYLFLFPIFFIIFNFVMLHKNKYNKLVIIIQRYKCFVYTNTPISKLLCVFSILTYFYTQ